MRLGINSPVVTAVPGVHSPWERTAGIEELGAVAEAADRLGFDHLTCSEHVAVPVDIAEQRGGTYWDPLSTFGHLAARTSRIRFATQVLVLGYHHPLEIAKRYGTLDRVSGGRLVLGLGVGSLEEEFRLLGADFEGRGAIADDALAALRASLSRREPAYHGEHFDYEGLVVEPHAVQDRVPLWIGGRTPRSLRRALAHGDGWVPFGLPLDRLGEMVGAAALPDGFEVVLGAGRPLDPSGDAQGAAEALRKVSDAGATLVSVSLSARSAAHYVEQLEALAAVAGLTAGARARA
ncbi:TIGR03619 family F420-dependent LLM class oxidoreductase [Streptomyces sp. A1277]|uniref:TIGR03619 family F420-dependent LLM class oxidoreductase n=1 Tax=Streptomyces sp. A1277 TaxID=2563103 RepID=UPI0010A28B70|nr:TIGR03619 family F420-dependent LLM class oxidoreductase [Streptomyces sp. A1277]THA31655.1 TIGR03619 family F420-dependent LLM class oxidoreductase [Streptomyces sp. A1277]